MTDLDIAFPAHATAGLTGRIGCTDDQIDQAVVEVVLHNIAHPYSKEIDLEYFVHF